jgi:large subunit ribosomal protein L10
MPGAACLQVTKQVRQCCWLACCKTGNEAGGWMSAAFLNEVNAMALTLEEKKAVVAEVGEVAKGAYSAVAAEYCGLTVEELTNLRIRAREENVYLRVVKNTLARRALSETDFECMNDRLTGPLILAFSREDPGAAARVAKDFAREHDKFSVTMLSVGGELLEATDIDRLAKLPTRDQALSMLMSVMQAPVAKFVRTLNEVPGKLVRTTAAVRDQKQQAA